MSIKSFCLVVLAFASAASVSRAAELPRIASHDSRTVRKLIADADAQDADIRRLQQLVSEPDSQTKALEFYKIYRPPIDKRDKHASLAAQELAGLYLYTHRNVTQSVIPELIFDLRDDRRFDAKPSIELPCGNAYQLHNSLLLVVVGEEAKVPLLKAMITELNGSKKSLHSELQVVARNLFAGDAAERIVTTSSPTDCADGLLRSPDRRAHSVGAAIIEQYKIDPAEMHTHYVGWKGVEPYKQPPHESLTVEMTRKLSANIQDEFLGEPFRLHSYQTLVLINKDAAIKLKGKLDSLHDPLVSKLPK